jgi:hypothetical protein
MKIEVGRTYVLRSDKALGDYSGSTVTVEKGPRNPDKPQYRVTWSEDPYDVDWIDLSLFEEARCLRLG